MQSLAAWPLGSLMVPTLFLVAACANTLQVLTPQPTNPTDQVNGYTITAPPLNQLSFKVTFNNPVAMASVVPGQTLRLTTSKDPNAGGSLSWSPDRKVLTFTTTKGVDDLLFQNPDASFCLTLVGTDAGQGVVKDDTGKALDGDLNGTSGGDWKMCFTRIG
jgi:hypothetical protein